MITEIQLVDIRGNKRNEAGVRGGGGGSGFEMTRARTRNIGLHVEVFGLIFVIPPAYDVMFLFP